MRGLRMATALLVGATIMIAASAARAADQGCAKIVAVLEEGGGGLSADEIARKTSTDVETVRTCTDAWRQGHKDPKAAQGASGAAQPMATGCAKVVAALDQGGGGLSADEIARKTSTDVETVRSCTDAWRASMKGGGHQ